MRTAIARPHGRGRLQLNARLVREKDRARLRELRHLAMYGAAIVVPLLVYVWQRVDFIRISYSLEALNHEQQQLQELNKQYTLERSSLLAPDRIEKVARKQLGLTDPSPADVRRVQVIDGQVNEVDTTVASVSPAAGGPPVTAPTTGSGPVTDDRGSAVPAAKPRPTKAAVVARRATGNGTSRVARNPRAKGGPATAAGTAPAAAPGAGADVYSPASILPSLPPPPDKPEEGPR